MSLVNIHEAKTQLSRLLVQAEAGEEVVIARNGKSAAQLVLFRDRGKRRFGALRGKISISESFFDPLPEAELAVWARRIVRTLLDTHAFLWRLDGSEKLSQATAVCVSGR